MMRLGVALRVHLIEAFVISVMDCINTVKGDILCVKDPSGLYGDVVSVF